MKTKSKAIQILATLAVGVAVGTMLTASLAPNYGTDLLRKINAKKHKITKKLKGTFNGIVADTKKVAETELDEAVEHINGMHAE